jgi:hypothetical protein
MKAQSLDCTASSSRAALCAASPGATSSAQHRSSRRRPPGEVATVGCQVSSLLPSTRLPPGSSTCSPSASGGSAGAPPPPPRHHRARAIGPRPDARAIRCHRNTQSPRRPRARPVAGRPPWRKSGRGRGARPRRLGALHRHSRSVLREPVTRDRRGPRIAAATRQADLGRSIVNAVIPPGSGRRKAAVGLRALVEARVGEPRSAARPPPTVGALGGQKPAGRRSAGGGSAGRRHLQAAAGPRGQLRRTAWVAAEAISSIGRSPPEGAASPSAPAGARSRGAVLGSAAAAGSSRPRPRRAAAPAVAPMN